MILIGLGSNLAAPGARSPRQTLERALAALAASGLEIAARSGWYETEPVPASDQPWFVNAVAALAAAPDPLALLDRLQQIEREFGRSRGVRNAARTLDLDLLDHCGRLIDTERLALPHPRLHQRRFVLMPLCEIAPDWRHPRLGLTAAELLARLPEGQPARRIPDTARPGQRDTAR